jgi:hypothetical protein
MLQESLCDEVAVLIASEAASVEANRNNDSVVDQRSSRLRQEALKDATSVFMSCTFQKASLRYLSHNPITRRQNIDGQTLPPS